MTPFERDVANGVFETERSDTLGNSLRGAGGPLGVLTDAEKIRYVIPDGPLRDTYETKDSGARQQFEGGGQRDVEDGKIDYTLAYDGPMFERYAALMTRGAKKYEARNWMKFSDEAALARAKRSLARHYHQYMAGAEDEDHAAAIVFNLNVIERINGFVSPQPCILAEAPAFVVAWQHHNSFDGWHDVGSAGCLGGDYDRGEHPETYRPMWP